MTELEKMMMVDAIGTPSDPAVRSIADLAASMMYLQEQADNLEAQLKETTNQLKRVQEELLPEAMAACGMSEFKLASGVKISIKEDVYASIRKDFIPQAVQYLESIGLGGIIKDEVSIGFTRDNGNDALALMELCKEFGYSPEEKLAVHPMTLKATVKEQLARGVQFPDEFFSVYPYKKATIKRK